MFCFFFFFFFNAPATPELYTLSLHDALPILTRAFTENCSNTPVMAATTVSLASERALCGLPCASAPAGPRRDRSEEHTSELQSQSNLVCRLLLEKKKKTQNKHR